MASRLFALGDIDPILVGRYSGFDLPEYTSLTRLLSDGLSDGPHEVLQSSGIPYRQAVITATLTEPEDVASLRAYHLSKEAVLFIDGNGDETTVRVLELSTDDFTGWVTATCTLLALTDTAQPS